jgi:hypothetical protein
MPSSIVIVGAGPNLGLAAQLEGEGITAAGAAADIRDAHIGID